MDKELYELLKKAEFPFKDHAYNEMGGCENRLCDENYEMCTPLLEEVINECGEEFVYLEYDKGNTLGDWHARGYKLEHFWESGKTALEAVIKLYLELKGR